MRGEGKKKTANLQGSSWSFTDPPVFFTIFSFQCPPVRLSVFQVPVPTLREERTGPRSAQDEAMQARGQRAVNPVRSCSERIPRRVPSRVQSLYSWCSVSFFGGGGVGFGFSCFACCKVPPWRPLRNREANRGVAKKKQQHRCHSSLMDRANQCKIRQDKVKCTATACNAGRTKSPRQKRLM